MTDSVSDESRLTFCYYLLLEPSSSKIFAECSEETIFNTDYPSRILRRMELNNMAIIQL